MLGVMLEEASSIVLDGATLVVTFAPAGERVRRMLAGDENTEAIEALVGRALGRPVALKLNGAAESERRPERVHPEETPGPGDRRGSTLSPEPTGESRPAVADRARKDPAVRKLLEEFGAQIVDVRPVAPPEASETVGTSPEETP